MSLFFISNTYIERHVNALLINLTTIFFTFLFAFIFVYSCGLRCTFAAFYDFSWLIYMPTWTFYNTILFLTLNPLRNDVPIMVSFCSKIRYGNDVLSFQRSRFDVGNKIIVLNLLIDVIKIVNKGLHWPYNQDDWLYFLQQGNI